jgi:ParB family chromosome partitioning protein
MQLIHIEFSNLKISKTNMRYRDPAPDVSDILQSIREKGVLMPLLVRPEDGKFGVVAGRRRWFSLKAIKEETGEVTPPPCAVMEAGDDADAIEASLLENVARRDPDPMREYETFVQLIKEGRTVDGIAATFGMTATQVRQRLALGNLLPAIRDAYRTEKIDDETVRHLTMASAAQQKKWLKLFNDPRQYAPRGYQLKQWLLGGQQIATTAALFKLSDYTGQLVEDLFGEESYFADADLFWSLQNQAIADKRDGLLKAGWNAVNILEIGQRFRQHEYVRVSKKKGGKVFVEVHHDGTVEVFDGWLSQKEARKAEKAAERSTKDGQRSPVASTGAIVTHALQNYLDLHRQMVVRQALLANPQIALRLAVAHMAAPSGNWTVRPDPQTARTSAICHSIEANIGTEAFAAEGHAVQSLLGWREDEDGFNRHDTAQTFSRLFLLSNDDVLRIAAYFMARSLEVGSAIVEEAGAVLKADARSLWHADATFFDLIRDRATVNALVSDVAGEAVAKANVAEKAKTQKQIIRDCLTGTNGRSKVSAWLPGWLEFPGRGVGQGSAAVTHDDTENADPLPLAAE